MTDRVRIEGAAGLIVCDLRHLPIAVASWRGAVEAEVIERFGAWIDAMLDELERRGHKGAMIVDVTRSEPPTGEARRALVNMRAARMQRVREHLVEDFVVLDRPALRAAMKALNWIAPQQQGTPIATLDEALRLAREALARAGVDAPVLSAVEFEGG